jgi:ADP-heptose synthase, bifunctional sugar kinase/adenylyltransferase
MGNSICPDHAGRTRNDAFPAERSAALHPHEGSSGFRCLGCGDTAIALFTLGLVCGATPIEAAEIANHGSAVVVSKLGTATVTRDELIASFREDSEDG